jgi:hypothetical protein
MDGMSNKVFICNERAKASTRCKFSEGAPKIRGGIYVII